MQSADAHRGPVDGPVRLPLRTLLLLTGMGLMIPCYLFTVGNVCLSPWPLYERNRVALVLLTAGWMEGLVLMARALGRTAVASERAVRWVRCAAVLGVALIQFGFGQFLRVTPSTDFDVCYYGALDYVHSGMIPQNALILMCVTPNNFALFELLVGAVRCVEGLGLPVDTYHLLINLNILLFAAGLYALLCTAQLLGGSKAQLYTALLMVLCAPMLYCTSELYTDSFCMPFLMMGFYALVRMLRADGLRGLGWGLASGTALIIGIMIRATLVVPVIAAVIVVLLARRPRQWICLVSLLCALSLGWMGYNHARNAEYGRENLERYSMPATHWMVMGTPDEYGYFYGEFSGDDYAYAYSFEDPQERSAALLQRLRDKLYRLRMPDRALSAVSRKNLSIFGTGTYRLDRFTAFDPADQEMVDALPISNSGAGHLAYRHAMTALMMADMLLACLGCLRSLRERRAMPGDALVNISLLGIFLLLMIWEAGGRYFFHFMPVLILAAALSLGRIAEGERVR